MDLDRFVQDLWDAGWRYDDEDEIKEQFGLTDGEAELVCNELLMLEHEED